MYCPKGSYQCLAESEYDSCQSSAELKLGDIAPVILETFKDAIIESSTSLSLRCTASATPLPQIKWFLDDWPVPNFARFRAGDYVTPDAKVVSYVNITSTRVVDGGEVSIAFTANTSYIHCLPIAFHSYVCTLFPFNEFHIKYIESESEVKHIFLFLSIFLFNTNSSRLNSRQHFYRKKCFITKTRQKLFSLIYSIYRI
jgi:hypothetical protein